MTTLRIALVAPIARAVHPAAPSSIEALIWLLAEELVHRGHDVTLYATGDSVTSARLRAPYPRGYNDDPKLWDWDFHETVHLATAFEEAAEHDVIHSHTYFFPPPLCRLAPVPAVHTDHILASPGIRATYARSPELCVVALSRYHQRKLGSRRVPIVANGIDVERFPAGDGGGGYLLFCGHLIPKKGPLEAVRLARETGLPLILAGKGGDYYQAEVAPYVDGRHITYLGPVGPAERDQLMAAAGALVFTSCFNEPFGLVMIEAMACGTPVLALRRCAVPEIVEPGLTGFHAPDAAELAGHAPAALTLDRAGVRRRALERFHYRHMVDGYEGLYHQLSRRRLAEARP